MNLKLFNLINRRLCININISYIRNKLTLRRHNTIRLKLNIETIHHENKSKNTCICVCVYVYVYIYIYTHVNKNNCSCYMLSIRWSTRYIWKLYAETCNTLRRVAKRIVKHSTSNIYFVNHYNWINRFAYVWHLFHYCYVFYLLFYYCCF